MAYVDIFESQIHHTYRPTRLVKSRFFCFLILPLKYLLVRKLDLTQKLIFIFEVAFD